MCNKCDGFNERLRIDHPHELYDLVNQLRETIGQGTFQSAGGNCKIEDIAPNKSWSHDYLECFFVCTVCAKSFRLYAETYHGAGGWWESVIPDI